MITDELIFQLAELKYRSSNLSFCPALVPALKSVSFNLHFNLLLTSVCPAQNVPV